MIKVVDDLIPVDYQNFIIDLILNQEISFYYHPNIVDPREIHRGKDNIHAFTHQLYQEKTGYSKFLPSLMPLTMHITEKTGVGYTMLDRMRFNFATGCESDMLHHLPHVDNFYPHLVAIYYVNTCDGDTFIFDQKNESMTLEEDERRYEENVWTVKERITPKRGRLVIFDGSQYHASSYTTGDYRCVINMNLVP